jgi:hypothetical protein
MRSDRVRLGAAVILGAAAATAFHEGRGLYRPRRVGREDASVTAPAASAKVEQRQQALGVASSTSGDPASGAGDEPDRRRALKQLEQINDKLANVQREKAELLRERRGLEEQLRSAQDEIAQRDRYKYDLTPEDWKKLAAESSVRYRMPCLMPGGAPRTLSEKELDELGLSPEDGKVLTAAYKHSNDRMWATLRPLCLKLVGSENVVDLLGAMNCLHLVEDAAFQRDSSAAFAARRQVAEVHAGLRAPPGSGEARHPSYDVLMAASSEGDRFEAELAESFGPDEAKRIWRSLRCVATRD